MSSTLPVCMRLLVIRADLCSATEALTRLYQDSSGLDADELTALDDLARRHARTCDVIRKVHELVPSEHIDYVHCLCFHLLHDIMYLQHARVCRERAGQYRDDVDAQQVPRVLLYDRVAY